ncbi:MAG: hypothetical protein MI757_02245, partial [Pirellulales bacterium]|nr:hypothetical protein [Pirellulales bacterium]
VGKAVDRLVRIGLLECVDQKRQIRVAGDPTKPLRFKKVQVKKRKLNRLVSGTVAIGAAPAPIKEYCGPTSKVRVKRTSIGRSADTDESHEKTSKKCVLSGTEGQSLGNVSRGDRTQLGPFLERVSAWSARIREALKAVIEERS